MEPRKVSVLTTERVIVSWVFVVVVVAVSLLHKFVVRLFPIGVLEDTATILILQYLQ